MRSVSITQEDLTGKIAEHIKNMPSLPTSVSKVLNLCGNSQTSPADLNYVISLDPVLVGRVLKLLNSAYYGLDQRVTNLVRAIIMLGINTIKNLALSSAIMGILPKDKRYQGLDMEGFWRHSLCVGTATKLLAKERGVDPKQLEEYFTAGLLHDIGKIPLNAVLSGDYMLAVASADRERIPLYQAESKTLGTSHCIVGAAIVNAWHLPGPVGETIVYHHDLARYRGAHHDILNCVAVANHFASDRELGFSGDRYPVKPNKRIWQSLEIGDEVFEKIEKTVNEEIEKAKVFLTI
ncbi:MAG: HDOD domain-containing protein [Treponema sp.]|nr:HDOD domain-containing protein [Treponema sp.]